MAVTIDISVPTKGNLEFDFTNSLITVENTIDKITLQELADAIRDVEDELLAENFPHIANMTGKSDLGNNVYTGIVVELLNGWQIVSDKTSGAFTILDGTLITTGSAGEVFADNALVSQINLMTQSGAISVVEVSSIGQELAYGGAVYLDLDNGEPGFEYPIGTLARPVNNLTDAKTILDGINATLIMLAGTLTLAQSTINYSFESWRNGKIDINGQTMTGTKFKDLKVYGDQNGLGIFDDCRVADLQNMNGVYNGCQFIDGSTLVLALSSVVSFNNCIVSGYLESGIDIHFTVGGTAELSVRNFSGGMTIENVIDTNDICSIGFLSGNLKISSTCTGGNIHVGGVASLTDNSTGSTVNTDALVNQSLFADSVWDEDLSGHTSSGTAGNIMNSITKKIKFIIALLFSK